jgi:hypothetical protein
LFTNLLCWAIRIGHALLDGTTSRKGGHRPNPQKNKQTKNKSSHHPFFLFKVMRETPASSDTSISYAEKNPSLPTLQAAEFVY